MPPRGAGGFHRHGRQRAFTAEVCCEPPRKRVKGLQRRRGSGRKRRQLSRRLRCALRRFLVRVSAKSSVCKVRACVRHASQRRMRSVRVGERAKGAWGKAAHAACACGFPFRQRKSVSSRGMRRGEARKAVRACVSAACVQGVRGKAQRRSNERMRLKVFDHSELGRQGRTRVARHAACTRRRRVEAVSSGGRLEEGQMSRRPSAKPASSAVFHAVDMVHAELRHRCATVHARHLLIR